MTRPLAGRAFPDCVPILVDPASAITLRAHTGDDLQGIVEQSNDPQTLRFTNVQLPDGGYTLTDALQFLTRVVAPGWEDGSRSCWAIESERSGERQYCGTIELRQRDVGLGEIAFALHPDARGQQIMSTAARLVVAYGFDVTHLQGIRWRAHVGNWASRRVAVRAGFRFEGTQRMQSLRNGAWSDGWSATITASDRRVPDVSWLEIPTLTGDRVTLRAFAEADVVRIAEACADPRTQHWLVSLPRDYATADAEDWIEFSRGQAATGKAMTWCLASPDDGRCLGAITLDGLGSYAPRAEIGYWAHPEARGRGAMTEAVELVTDWALEELVDSLVIRCAAENHASRHVAESAGYRLIGVQPASEPLGDHTLADLVSYSRP